MRQAFIAVGLIFLSAAGCSSEPAVESEPAPPEMRAPRLAGLPIEMNVRQRSTTVVPGSAGAVSLTIDDVTRGQVMASLAGDDGKVVLGPTSLGAGKSATFKLGGESYFLLLDSLDNELVGDDSATFVISETLPTDETVVGEPEAEAAEPSSEQLEAEKIGQLIEHVGSLERAAFIRNGEEYSPAEAAAHLRRKWENLGGEIATVEQFIEHAASKSSLSGEPYKIRLEDGTERTSAEYLRGRLAEMALAE